MRKSQNKQEEMIKNIIAIGGVGIGVLLIIISSILFIKNRIVSSNVKEEIGQVQENTDDFESASTEIGKTVEEVRKEENKKEENKKEENKKGEYNNSISKSQNIMPENNTSGNEKEYESEIKETEAKAVQKEDVKQKNEEKEETKKSINFIAPVKGEIIKEFALESLVYSQTLKEWITHKGIDIKADKTSVVTAASDGTVQSIKNDPRYGLTIIINHEEGFQTIYSNLLTAEFVVEGEKVTQGQTIGTIGNTASFEINDDYHLHFELLKDNQYQDPQIYIDI